MATYRELLSAPTKSLEEIWELFLDMDVKSGKELRQAADLLAEHNCTASVKRDLMERVRVRILGWKPKD